jgi:hypothetical protein
VGLCPSLKPMKVCIGRVASEKRAGKYEEGKGVHFF